MGNTCSGERDDSEPDPEHPKGKPSPKIEVDLKDNDAFIKKLVSELTIDEYSSFESENIGDKYVKIAQEYNKNLPIYIIFNPFDEFRNISCLSKLYCAKKRWERIIFLLNQVVKSHIDEPKYVTYNSLEECIDKCKSSLLNIRNTYESIPNVYNDIFFNDDHVSIYGNEIVPLTIYKKLKIKYDFYYIPLNLYNGVQTQIDLLKTIQVLELLGSSKIDINLQEEENMSSNIIGKINTGFITSNIDININDKSLNKANRDNSYEYIDRIFSDEVEFLQFIKNRPHIFIDIEDYNKDIEMKYLIISRIKSYLKSYHRSFHIRKLSSIEIKIQDKLTKLYKTYGLNFSYNNQQFEESTFDIKADFFKLEDICNINKVPMNSIGFEIVKKKFYKDESEIIYDDFLIREKVDNTKFKEEILRFYDKFLYKQFDIFKSKNAQTDYGKNFIMCHKYFNETNEKYRNLVKKIETYTDILELLNIIKYSGYFAVLNEEGFNTMKSKCLYKLKDPQVAHNCNLINSQYEIFAMRFAKLNSFTNIEQAITSIKKTPEAYNKISQQYKSFTSLKIILAHLLLNYKFIPLDNKEYMNILFEMIHIKELKRKKIELMHLAYRYIYSNELKSCSTVIISNNINDFVKLNMDKKLTYDIFTKDLSKIKDIIIIDNDIYKKKFLDNEIITNMYKKIDSLVSRIVTDKYTKNYMLDRIIFKIQGIY